MLTDPIMAPETVEIRATVRKALIQHAPPERVRVAGSSPGGRDTALWRLLAGLGLLGLTVDPALDGAGLGIHEQCVVFEELGRALAGAPALASVGLALPVLAAAGDSTTVKGLASGDVVAALVTGPGGGRWPTPVLSARTDNRGTCLAGRVEGVLDADLADRLVVITHDATGQSAWAVDVRAPGITVEAEPTIDVTRTLSTVLFADALAEPLALDSRQLQRALDVGAVVHAAEAVGAAGRALDMTLAYLRTRHQFGRPIGSMQALKHRCADAAVRLTLARELVYQCADLLDSGAEEGRDALVAAATSRAVEVFTDVAAEGIQMHGGIGFTEEHDIGLYYRRARVDQHLLESSIHARRRLSTLLGL